MDCPRTNYQNGVHTATRCPLLWGTVTVPEFYRGYLKKKMCVHLNVRRVSYSGTVAGYHVCTLP